MGLEKRLLPFLDNLLAQCHQWKLCQVMENNYKQKAVLLHTT
jgi:hypothetical protein